MARRHRRAVRRSDVDRWRHPDAFRVDAGPAWRLRHQLDPPQRPDHRPAGVQVEPVPGPLVARSLRRGPDPVVLGAGVRSDAAHRAELRRPPRPRRRTARSPSPPSAQRNPRRRSARTWPLWAATAARSGLAAALLSTVVDPAVTGWPSSSTAPGKASTSELGAVAVPVNPIASMSCVALDLYFHQGRWPSRVG